METILYTTHCPKCKVLEQKLQNKKIEYVEIDDIQRIKEMGIFSVPVLKVGDKLLDFLTAVSWVNNYNEA